MRKRVYLVTKGKYEGCQRQLAWFSRHRKDLYFEIFGFFMGSHLSYHRDGRIWRTSPATRRHPDYIKKYFPLDDFKGLYQSDLGMIRKSELLKNPCLKEHDRKKALALREVDFGAYPREIINIVVEFLEPGKQEPIMSKDVAHLQMRRCL